PRRRRRPDAAHAVDRRLAGRRPVRPGAGDRRRHALPRAAARPLRRRPRARARRLQRRPGRGRALRGRAALPRDATLRAQRPRHLRGAAPAGRRRAVSALVVPLAPETGEAPEQVAAAGAEAPPVGFVTLLARCSGPPGSGGARPSGEDQATGARTAQSEGAVKDTDIAEQVAANASANGPATALAQLSLQVPPDGAPTHTDDAPEPAAGAHEARPSGAAAG